MEVTVEICVEGWRSAVAAEAGGADRVELCRELGVGGLTPGAADVAEACERLRIPVHVLVRPRAGDFVYDSAEFAAMLRDIETAKALGAAGVVVGVNLPSAAIDGARTTQLVAAARPLSVTFHKAFDDLADPLAGLDDLAAVGVDRVLTSGRAATAREGLPLLAVLTRRSALAGRPVVMAGGRVREADLPHLLAAGLTEIHVGSGVLSAGATDPARVRRLVEAVRRIGAGLSPG